jgi:ATP adenylyltransferase
VPDHVPGPEDLDPGQEEVAAQRDGILDTSYDEAANVGPDGLQRLWMPHRLAYIKGEGKPAGASAVECPFCAIPKLSDADGLIVARGAQVYAVLNLYPYNSGHLMVVPYRHVADYTELTDAETAELADFTKRSMTALREASQAQGFNIGMNLGGVAGAGIAAHLHQHVVPRWGGDANFMPVVGRTKVLPQLLADTRVVLANAWPADNAQTP